MEVGAEFNQQEQPLVCKLMQGRELARQLETKLEPSSELPWSLLQQIISSIEDALSMAKPVDPMTPLQALPGPSSDSPRSVSDDNDNSDGTERRDVSKKRKTQMKWTTQVKVCPGSGLEGPIEDGYSWRKYGQKDILGAKHPRGYYRCTHRSTRDCPATKQVQRSDDDPSVFNVTYRGKHRCHQQPNNQSQMPTSSPRPQNQQQQPQHLLLNLGSSLHIKAEGSDGHHSIFSFPSTPTDPNNHIFSSSQSHINFTGTPNSYDDYFSFGELMNHHLGTSESDFTGIISATTPPSNTPMMELESDLDFQFDASSFFN
ncbi:putative WRKY transcription factor 41 [Acorus gramineus]|uniref:WRKY transcription factor 41 n=1 Tax=Acorus gramineus TaxID=55184 RepID=A0AAV9AWZ0_ACOGR|nr:putative WRKY transcription factor 41 [Acorus gramineus]